MQKSADVGAGAADVRLIEAEYPGRRRRVFPSSSAEPRGYRKGDSG